MRRLVIIILFSIVASYGCSKVNFGMIPNQSCLDAVNCVEVNGILNWKLNFQVGSVDILFVDDNSGSMSTEQAVMADKFGNFIDTLENKNINYQISIITTDVDDSWGENIPSTAAIGCGLNNDYKECKDGKFLYFPNKENILSPSFGTVQNRIDWFAATIQRPETEYCEKNPVGGYLVEPNCPSGDERGIYAANRAIERANTSFFRDQSHLAIVFLSDEDERSHGGAEGKLPLENLDYPEALVTKVSEQFGEGKTLSVHSIVIKPGDSGCKNEQTGTKNDTPSWKQWVIGEYGSQYAKLSNPSDALKSNGNILAGYLGSICSKSYGNQLSDIGSRVSEHSKKIQLPCYPTEIDIDLSPSPASPATYDIDSNNLLTFTSSVDAGTDVTIDLQCNKAL